MKRRSISYLAIAPALMLAVPAAAQDKVADFYKGKTVELIVAAGPGGGYSAYARTLAKHMSQYIPGQPKIIIKNLPGAGGRKATAFLANAAPKDGRVMLGTQPGALVEPILGNPKRVKYAPLKFGYVGSTAGFTTICLIRTGSPVKTFGQLLKTEVVFGGDQLGSTTHDHAMMFKNLVGAKIKLVRGYKGTKRLVLALQQKEIDGFCGYAWASMMSRAPHLVTDKLVNLVVQFGLEKHAEATKAGVPSIFDFVKDPKNKKVLELFAATQVFGRPYIVPAGVPADRLAALQAAFGKTMTDEGFLADMKKLRLDVTPTSGPRVTELLRNIFNAPADIQKLARDSITKG